MRVALALGLGAAGGAVFDALRMPLAWMIGAMLITTAASMAGARLWVPPRMRGVMIAVLGIMLGSSFTPEAVDRAFQWTGSLASLLLFVAVVIATLGLFLRYRAGFGPANAFFSSAPGGFSAMVLMGGAMGGDERTIALMHSVRMMLAVLIIPFWFRLFHGYQPGGTAAMGQIADIAATDAAILTLCAVVGCWVAIKMRLPVATLIGPMILSAAAHLSGLTSARPPGEIVAVAQVVIGAFIGCRFVGVPVKRVVGTMWLSGATTAMMMAITLTFALLLERLLGLPFQALLLAFAPGGLAEMSLVSLAMGIDTAFVATHHLVRIIIVVMLAPIAFRLLSRS
jgi:uncharacterized protein